MRWLPGRVLTWPPFRRRTTISQRDFFQLKELEKIGPKQKGIVAQSVKEALQSLVDDNLVTMEKIGTSNYYWSFPSTALQQVRLPSLQTLGSPRFRVTRLSDADRGTAPLFLDLFAARGNQRKRKIDDLTAERNQLCNKRAELETSLAKSTEGREACDGRESLLEELSKAEALRQNLLAELDQFRECDPELLAKKGATGAIGPSLRMRVLRCAESAVQFNVFTCYAQ
ncbi:MAG: Mnd1 family-domain-containing protein [Olpidium bornovanus]|uniref:Mnd1 family-domain-containing protein n=1 Tax=Olpidium bornovanus TaxID=278681 RepID=A0A8H7ZW13_9FUNG|nr:MAG: Mnd1 family-domain-containing protein [Olpidium bornovanus]